MASMHPVTLSESTSQAASHKSISPWRRWLKWLGFVAVGITTGYIAASVAVAIPLSMLLISPRPKRRRHLESMRLRDYLWARRIHYRETEFTSYDGTKLTGWFLDRGWWRPTVVGLHGVTGNRTSLIRFGILLYEAGFNVFLFDGRAHGHSSGRFVTYGYHEVRDVSAALDHISKKFRLRNQHFGLVGISMGAAIALQAAARDPRIAAVWAESPFSSLQKISREYVADVLRMPSTAVTPTTWIAELIANYRGNFSVSDVNPLAVAGKLTCPVYLVHGLADDFVRPHHSQAIFAGLVNAKEKNLWLVERATHGRCYRAAPEEHHARMPDFFHRHLGR
ncbi:MAG: alpha/beta hydrolase [Acidobacteriota bacterium]